jgi:ATP-dependent Clp protease, protease subunit
MFATFIALRNAHPRYVVSWPVNYHEIRERALGSGWQARKAIMASFPRDRRRLTRDTTLLIHGRRMMRNVHLEGPLGSCRRVLEEIIADIDNGLRVEDEGFPELIAGSAVSLDDIRSRSYGGWYLSATQALELGLVAGLV